MTQRGLFQALNIYPHPVLAKKIIPIKITSFLGSMERILDRYERYCGAERELVAPDTELQVRFFYAVSINSCRGSGLNPPFNPDGTLLERLSQEHCPSDCWISYGSLIAM